MSTSWRFLCRAHFLNGAGKPVLLDAGEAEQVETIVAELARHGLISHNQRFQCLVESVKPSKLRLEPLRGRDGIADRLVFRRHGECSCEYYGDAATPLQNTLHRPPVKAIERSVPLQGGGSDSLSSVGASPAPTSQAQKAQRET